jgi:glycosyltransferase involved in cell wall biosynthesis
MHIENMIKKNLVSILILNYNNQQYLDKAIKSCLNQTHKNIEIVIYDDKSNDNSKLKILKFKKNKKIKIFFNNDKKKNIAAFDAANGYERAFKKSRGEIICFLDSDDIFKKDKVEKIVNFFSKNKDCMLVQNMPMEFYRQNHQKKMNKNSYFSYWPYLAPESCISIKKDLMISYLKKTRKLKYKFSHTWFGFRIGVFSHFIKKNFSTIDNGLTIYKGRGQSNKYQHLSMNWFLRRKESFDYLYEISNKNIKYKLSFDYFITLIINFLFK